ncbi:MAG: DNA repair protein RecN [Chitinophagales bacterium]
MLKTLRIKNYAIINEAEISFSDKMNIITGETGAGKSILLGALSLIVGERADARVLFDKEKKCIVEAIFEISNYGLEKFFEEENIDFEKETYIRRELSDNGKSRAFINDTPVNLNVLQKLANNLVTIHSQHETLALGDSGFQLMVIDALANNEELLQSYKTQFRNWTAVSKKLKETEELARRALTEKDFIEFQFEELDKANLDNIDQLALENELTQLTHAEEIKKGLMQSVEQLDGGEENISRNLRAVITQLNTIVKYIPEIEPYIDRLESASVELKDISRDLDDKAELTVADPARSEDIQQQLNILFRLQKKHNLNTTSELINFRNELAAKLEAFINSEEEIEKLNREQNKLFVQVQLSAKKLSEKRTKEFQNLERSVSALLTEVGMKDAELKISHEFDIDKYLSERGADHVQYLFSANKGSALQDIKKVASGGELSRLMLCIKSLLAKTVALPTLIFDEIDTGVSGEIANKVGKILLKLSVNHQLIAITHLPQIASKGDHHMYVYKETNGKATQTKLKILNRDERLIEIAKMLSGEKPTKAAIENATELLEKI